MATMNQPVTARPNVLHGEAIPNTLGGIGLPTRTTRHGRSSRPFATAATAAAAGIALLLVLLAGRAA
jgi:hypothetical protein